MHPRQLETTFQHINDGDIALLVLHQHTRKNLKDTHEKKTSHPTLIRGANSSSVDDGQNARH